jgi:hypothetical protein
MAQSNVKGGNEHKITDQGVDFLYKRRSIFSGNKYTATYYNGAPYN